MKKSPKGDFANLAPATWEYYKHLFRLSIHGKYV